MAPHHLSTAKASAERTRTSATPTAERVAWTRQPAAIPAIVARPAGRPRVSTFRTTRSVSAPGVTARSVATRTNAQRWESMCSAILAPARPAGPRLGATQYLGIHRRRRGLALEHGEAV